MLTRGNIDRMGQIWWSVIGWGSFATRGNLDKSGRGQIWWLVESEGGGVGLVVSKWKGELCAY